MPSQQLLNDIAAIIDRNRANQGLRPLTLCLGGCGRRVEGDLCSTCSYEAELGRARARIEERDRSILAARAEA